MNIYLFANSRGIAMRIILVRHAKSTYDWEKYPTDAVRPLSEKGIKRQKQAAIGMNFFKLDFDKIWVSPYKRAQETLDIILKAFHISIEPIFVQELIPSGNERRLYSFLLEMEKITPQVNLLVVGHNPVLSALLEILERENPVPEMRTSEVAYCELTNNTSRLIRYFNREELLNSY